ncbi:MAG: ImmA/IrrE family metallo-endopeptidase [Candidatus Paceibacterota bacterium]
MKLELNIIPINGLQGLCDTDALITSDWSSIYVDHGRYWDERYKNRLRFSLAHEIGHFVLHKQVYNDFEIESVEHFYEFMEKIPGDKYGYLETQANKFANYLLVPRKELFAEKEKIIKRKRKALEGISEKMVNSYIAIPIAEIFGVSENVAEIALNDIIDLEE